MLDSRYKVVPLYQVMIKYKINAKENKESHISGRPNKKDD